MIPCGSFVPEFVPLKNENREKPWDSWKRWNEQKCLKSLVLKQLDTYSTFWHAILHRREPDEWNSNYWWKRVGRHPFLDELRRSCSAVGYEYATPEAFVAFCEKYRGSGSAEEAVAAKVQTLEWSVLFDYCFRKAVG